MRTKRILSLLLVFAMLAAMTISASAVAQSEVFLTEFYDYPSATAYYNSTILDGVSVRKKGNMGLEATHSYEYNVYNRGSSGATSILLSPVEIPKPAEGPWLWTDGEKIIASIARKRVPTLAELRALGQKAYGYHWNEGILNNASLAILPRTDGGPGNYFYTKEVNESGAVFGSGSVKLNYIPEEAWTAVDGEKFVLSYDIANTYNVVDYTWNGTLYTNHGRTNSINFNWFNLLFSDASGNITYSPVHTINNGYYNVATLPAETPRASIDNWYWPAQDEFHRFSVVLEKNGTGISRTKYRDGALVPTASTIANVSKFEAFEFTIYDAQPYAYSNLKMYTLKTGAGAFRVTAENTTDVPLSASYIDVKFTQPVEPTSFNKNSVVVKKDGVALDSSAFSVSDVTEVVGDVGEEIYSTVRVTFTEDLEAASDYTIEFPASTKNTIETQLGEYNTVSFTTETPDIMVQGYKIIKNWGEADEEEVDILTGFGNYGVEAEIMNTSAAAKNIAVIYAIYSTNGVLSNVAYVNDTIDADTTAHIGAGIAGITAGSTVKAFVWDGITSLKPWATALEKTVAAE